MSNGSTSSIYSAALMDHNAHPDYRYELEDATHSHDGINASCGDELTLYLKIDDTNDIIEEASFTGHGCAISQASADMMAGLIEGESIDEAKRLRSIENGPSVDATAVAQGLSEKADGSVNNG